MHHVLEVLGYFFPKVNGLLMLNFEKQLEYFFTKDECEAPSGLKLLGTRLDVYAPVLALACMWGAQIGFKACKSIAPKTEILGRYFWAQAFLWYALMSLSGLVCHCLYPGLKWGVIGDCVSTGLTSISIVYALATDAGFIDDSDTRPKIAHGLLSCLYCGLGVISQLPGADRDIGGWVVEGMYLTIIPCVGISGAIVVDFTLKGYRSGILGHWAMKAAVATLIITPAVLLIDRQLCNMTHGYFNTIVIYFLLCDLFMILMTLYFHGTMFERLKLDHQNLAKKNR